MYIFGIDMPLMEIFFVLVILLIVALIFILIELRKMRIMIRAEQKDLTILDKNLMMVENLINNNPSTKLLSYVADKLEKGTPKATIRKALLKTGFDNKAITKIFSKLN